MPETCVWFNFDLSFGVTNRAWYDGWVLLSDEDSNAWNRCLVQLRPQLGVTNYIVMRIPMPETGVWSTLWFNFDLSFGMTNRAWYDGWVLLSDGDSNAWNMCLVQLRPQLGVTNYIVMRIPTPETSVWFNFDLSFGVTNRAWYDGWVLHFDEDFNAWNKCLALAQSITWI